MEIQSIIRKRNFVERIKALIFLEAVLAIEIIQEPQSNLEKKVDFSTLKDDFSSKTDPSILTSMTFSSFEINKPLPVPVHIVWLVP